MQEPKLDEWFPFYLGWFLKASQDWDPAKAGPVVWVLCKMWPAGGRLPNDPRKLAAAARVSVRAWAGIRDMVGDFFRVEGDFLIQDHLAAKYAENLKKSEKRISKAVNAANERWEKSRYANAPSIAPSNAPRIAWTHAPDLVRASSCIDPDLDLKRGEEANARVMPMSAEEIDAEIDAAIKAYPTRRELPGGGTTGVYIGEDAKALARAYLAANPHYPLKLAAQYTAKTDKRPRNWATWIANPPATSVVLTAYEATLKERAERRAASEAFEPADPTALRAKVREITDHAKKEAAHA